MANWGVPDYDTSEVIDYDALHARIKKESPDALLRWPNEVAEVQAGYSPIDVATYCVNTKNKTAARWQKVRLSMKGKPTHVKLAILVEYVKDWSFSRVPYDVEVQAGNYLGALRRGGQLNEHNEIRKYK